MSRSRLPLYLGGAAVAGVGYYFYQAGGNPKVAEKQFQADASKLSSRMRGELPGKEKEIKSQAKLRAEEANQKLEGTLESAKREADQFRADASRKFDEVSKATDKNIHTAMDKFDKKVEEGTAKSKSWFSGWFGSK